MSRKGNDKRSPSGRLRIVAGKWRSRLLPIVDYPGLRPTSARVRETLFNWLNPVIEGASCLDLFAGSGALGFEALSRGASRVDFVENAPRVAAMLRSNITTLDADGAYVHEIDAFEYLVAVGKPAFDIVFLDPPFANNQLKELCRLLSGNNVLAPDCRIYLEQEGADALPGLPEGWKILREKTAGNVRYALVTNKIKRTQ